MWHSFIQSIHLSELQFLSSSVFIGKAMDNFNVLITLKFEGPSGSEGECLTFFTNLIFDNIYTGTKLYYFVNSPSTILQSKHLIA